MNKAILLALVALLLIPSLVAAHGPSRLRVTEEIQVNAPPEKVWDLIKDFCAIAEWHPAIAKCQGEGGNEDGATRLLTLDAEGDPTILETMRKYEPEKMSYQYRITEVDVNVIPVTTYAATLSVEAGDNGGAKVVWKGGFYRGYTLNEPPPELNDEAAINAITGIYQAGLANIKKLAEQ